MKVSAHWVRAVAAIAVVVIWMIITMIGTVYAMEGPATLYALITTQIAWGTMVGVAFLLLVARVLHWTDLGLTWPAWQSTFHLCWLPVVHILLLAALVAVGGTPKLLDHLSIAAVNVAAIAIGEELAFRGVLWSGVRKIGGFWQAFVTVCLIFGMAHMSNVFATGDIGSAVVQSVAAAMTGAGFLALRIRTGSIAPVIVLHAVWNFVVLGLNKEASGTPAPFEQHLVLSLILVLPTFLYGLWLVRNPLVRGDWLHDNPS